MNHCRTTYIAISTSAQWLGHPASGSRFYQASRRWIINILSDSSIPYAFDHLVHYEERNKKPLPWSDQVVEAILDFNIQLRAVEHTMKNVFELDPVDVTKLVGSDDFHVGHQEGRVQVSVCYPCVDLASC